MCQEKSFDCNVKLPFCRKQDAEHLIKRYFNQVTKGCGQQHCDNDFCASGKLQRPSNMNEAAILALNLLKRGAKLCSIGRFLKHF